MKRLFIAFILLLLPSGLLAETAIVDNGYPETIKNYEVDASLAGNGTLSITENITYDFGNNEKHGIFRYIPTVYASRHGNPRQNLKIVSINNQNGKFLTYKKTFENNSVVIKIGDENTLLTGQQKYKVKYSLTNAVSSDSDGDRLRWDALGTGWNVPINNVTIALHQNEYITGQKINVSCYSGPVNSGDGCDTLSDGDTIIAAQNSLNTHSGITLDVLYQKGTFIPPSALELIIWGDRWYLALPLIAFAAFLFVWFRKGKDPVSHDPLVARYDPPKNITPMEASIILEEIIDKKALPAMIISLAVNGYLKIHRKETKALFHTKPEYELLKGASLPQNTPEIDRAVYEIFFTGRDRVNLKDLGDTFPSLNQYLHKKAYKRVVKEGFFVTNPNISRIVFILISTALLIVGLAGSIYFLLGINGFLCFLLPGLIGLGFAFIMPARTPLGVQTKKELLGLKMYIKKAEIDRIKFHNAPVKTPEVFERLLPYAIIFGLEKEWAKQFEGMYSGKPSWYDGNFSTFSIIGLTNDLSGFSDAAISAAASASSGSSGGFSGGGMGGGGGGSW